MEILLLLFPGADPENSERGARDICLLASKIEIFYFSDDFIKIPVIQNFKEKGWPQPPWPTPKSVLDFFYIYNFVKLNLHGMTLLHVMCLQKAYDMSCLLKSNQEHTVL